MALNDLANQVAALKTSIESALATALDKNEAIAAAAYAKALETLVKPDGVVTLINEADTQIARVTTEGDTQFTRINGLLGENFIAVDTTVSDSSGETYVATADLVLTIPDDRPQGWRVTILTTEGANVTIAEGNNTITGLPGADTGVLGPRSLIQLRAVSANNLEVW